MFLSGVLFVLFLAGCWLYCLTDAALTPAAQFPGLRKRTWVGVIAMTFILGAIAWVITRKSRRAGRRPLLWTDYSALADYDGTNVRWYPRRPTTADASRADAALARHPASQSRRPGRPRGTVPLGPDDDPEFLRQLAERIRGEQ
jgi:hypothetical protein